MNWSGSDEGAQVLAPTPANLRDIARAATVVAGAGLLLSVTGLIVRPAPFTLAGWLAACALNAALLIICARRAQLR